MTKLESMISQFIEHADSSMTQFTSLIKSKHSGLMENGQTSLHSVKIIQELINLDDIAKFNLKRLKRITEKLRISGVFSLETHQQKRELQALIIKTSTSIDLISDIVGKKNLKIANLVDNTLERIDQSKLLSAS